MPAIATIVPFGTLISPSSYTTPPWELWGLTIPGFGSPPTYAQFFNETLQPKNTDGARFRIGGAHFAEFQLVGIVPAQDFPSAGLVAREIERTKGDFIEFQYTRSGASPYSFFVKEARCMANAARILGASVSGGGGGAGGGGPAPSTEAMASVDIMLTLQYSAPV